MGLFHKHRWESVHQWQGTRLEEITRSLHEHVSPSTYAEFVKTSYWCRVSVRQCIRCHKFKTDARDVTEEVRDGLRRLKG